MDSAVNNDCIFCNLPKERIVLQNELSLAFFDGFPVSKGHALIIPRRHVVSYFDLTKDEIMAMHQLLQEVKVLVERSYLPDGYNLGVNIGADAGQSIYHVHMHLIPRYKGDVANPRGGVRGVIPAKQNY